MRKGELSQMAHFHAWKKTSCSACHPPGTQQGLSPRAQVCMANGRFPLVRLAEEHSEGTYTAAGRMACSWLWWWISATEHHWWAPSRMLNTLPARMWLPPLRTDHQSPASQPACGGSITRACGWAENEAAFPRPEGSGGCPVAPPLLGRYQQSCPIHLHRQKIHSFIQSAPEISGWNK